MSEIGHKKNNSIETMVRKKVSHRRISADEATQRIDNFLMTALKGVPKSRIYRLLRKGEVRVNKKRISPFYKLVEGDEVRLPPVFVDEKASAAKPAQSTTTMLVDRILYEDDYLIVLNKPSGMSVHAGSTVRVGVIEALRHHYPKLPHLELAHRLDSETSGCLVLAKKKKILRELHECLREGKMTKIYWALTAGQWTRNELKVDVPLHKEYRDGGKHVVIVKRDGKTALTYFKTLSSSPEASLMEVRLMTGRTHQIRVHAAHQGHPIACDDRYGDPEFNKWAKQRGLRRLFLHARSIEFTLPSLDLTIKVEAPLDLELLDALKSIKVPPPGGF